MFFYYFRLQFERIINHLIHLLHLTSSSSSFPSQTLTTLKSLIITAKHKLDLINIATTGSSPSPPPPHIFYQLLESPAHSHVSPSRLSSIPSSLTNSRSSMTPMMAAGRLHLLPEALAGSTKSLVGSRMSASTQSHVKPSTISSAKSLMPSVPTIGTGCCVQCGPELSFGYGFEYYGSDSCVLLSPVTEKCLVGLLGSVARVDGGNGIMFDGGGGKSKGCSVDCVGDVAKVRASFSFVVCSLFHFVIIVHTHSLSLSHCFCFCLSLSTFVFFPLVFLDPWSSMLYSDMYQFNFNFSSVVISPLLPAVREYPHTPVL